jgi:Tfp pilus assembly protein PilF
MLAGCAGGPLRRDDPGRLERPAAPLAATPRAGSDATAALLQEAAVAASQGDAEKAAALLERALRVAPEDPLPWNRLAGLRLRQGQGSQAEQLAVKSNRLAGQQALLRAENWRIIAGARRLAGDESGARTAEEKAERFEGR